MGKAHEANHLIEHDWELVVHAYNARFPTHEMMKCMVHSEELEREEDKENNTLKVVRRIHIDPETPGFIKKLSGLDVMIFVETMHVRWGERVMTLSSYNETLRTKVTIGEECRYTPHPENPTHTLMNQVGSFELLVSLLGLRGRIESWGIERYKAGMADGRALDNKLIQDHKSKSAAASPTSAEGATEVSSQSGSVDDDEPVVSQRDVADLTKNTDSLTLDQSAVVTQQ